MFVSKKVQISFLPVIFLSFLLAPVFELKLLFFLASILLIVNNVSVIRKAEIWMLLGIMFAFSYINSPYWQIVPDPKMKILFLLSLIIGGGIWSYFAASDIALKSSSLPVWPVVALTGLLLAVNYNPLITDIAWRGDESAHVYMLANLVQYVKNASLLRSPFNTTVSVLYLGILVIVAAYLLLVRAKKIQKTKTGNVFLAVFVGITIILPAIVLFNRDLPLGWRTDVMTVNTIIRWPFQQKWAAFIFLFPNFDYDIRLYRVIPLVGAIFTGWYLFKKFENTLRNHIVSGICSFSFMTVPLVYYFSTIFYLEMAIVLVMTYCVFNIRDVLFDDAHTLMRKPVWIALLLLGFLKETVAIILILLLVSRCIAQLLNHKFTAKLLFSEISVSILAMVPLVTYLLIRNYTIHERPYTPGLDILLIATNYVTVLKALWDQTGMLFPFSIAGLTVVFLKKERVIGLTLLVLYIGIVLFHMLDGQLYIGYSRWNLILMPVIFYLAYRFLIPAPRPILYMFLTVLLIGNYFLNPIMPDGTRISNWGCPNTDGAEYYYPYERAIRYLSTQKDKTSVLILGQYFPHWGIQFYQAKYGFYPRFVTHQFNGNQPDGVLSFDGRRFNIASEQNYLSAFFTECAKSGSETAGIDAIIYHSVHNVDLNMDDVYCGSFRITKRIRNSLNSLYIFE